MAMARLLSFGLGAGTVALAYGNLRDSLFEQQRAVFAKLSGNAYAESRNDILSGLDTHRQTLFETMTQTWNGAVLDAYVFLAGRRPK